MAPSVVSHFPGLFWLGFHLYWWVAYFYSFRIQTKREREKMKEMYTTDRWETLPFVGIHLLQPHIVHSTTFRLFVLMINVYICSFVTRRSLSLITKYGAYNNITYNTTVIVGLELKVCSSLFLSAYMEMDQKAKMLAFCKIQHCLHARSNMCIRQ